MRKAIAILCVVACAAAVQVDYVAPATSYVYRSDNGGPAGLIQVGPPIYEQPRAFVPLKAIEAYNLAPVPLPYINTKPIAIEDAEEDDENDEGYDEGSDEGSDESENEGLIEHGHESGAGNTYGEEHHNAHGSKGSKGYSTKGHHAKGVAGNYGKAHDEGFYHQDKGEKGGHYDSADAHGAHHESGKGYKGGNHGHKKHSSKGEDVTGYHKVFHKDEYKKDHDFYDEAAKNGHFNKHGYQKAYHGSEKGAHEKGGHKGAGFNKEGYGKSGYLNKGHVDKGDEGHSAEEGSDSHYNHQEDYGKKGGSAHDKEYGYADDDEHDGE